MESKISRNLSLFLIVVSFVIAFSLFNSMPEKMPTHWNEKGEIDGYGNRFIGLFLFPLIMIFVFAIFHFLPKLAVHKKNIMDSIVYINDFKVIMMVFFFGMYIATLLPNFGFNINMSYIIIPFIFILFFYIGHILPKIKKNYFIGIRTPWTLSNDKVWEKTHILGGKLFKVSAFIMLLGFYPSLFIWAILGIVILDVVVLFTYSYLEFKKSGDGGI